MVFHLKQLSLSKSISIVLLTTLLLIWGNNKSHAQTNWSLKHCIDSALANNLNVQQQTNNVALNKISFSQSKLNELPIVNGNADQNLTSEKLLNSTNYQYGNSTVWSNNFSLTGSVTLYNGLQNKNAIKQNQLNYESSKFDLDDEKYNISLNILNAYLLVILDSELIKTAKEQLAATDSELTQVSAMVEAGKKLVSDSLDIAAQVASDKYTLATDIGQFQLALVNLQQLMNKPVSEGFNIDYPLIEPKLNTLENINEIYKQSLAFQPIVKSYDLKLQSSGYGIKIARGALLPKLSLNAGLSTDFSSAASLTSVNYRIGQEIGYLQSNPSDVVLSSYPQPIYSSNNYPFFNQIQNNWVKAVYLSLTIPIFNNYQARNNIQKQIINQQNSQLNLDIVKTNLRKAVEQAFINSKTAREQYNAAKNAVDDLAASFQNAVALYQNGKMTTTDLLQEKYKYTNALSQGIQAKYQLIFMLKILDYYQGLPLNL